MGRYSNIILVNEKGLIIDCIRKVDERTSSYREVMPARVYRLPPPQERIIPADASALQKFRESLLSVDRDIPVSSLLQKTFSGLSRRPADCIARKAGLDPSQAIGGILGDRSALDPLFDAVGEVLKDVRENNYSPVIICDGDGSYSDFHVLSVCSENRIVPFSTASACADEFYKGKDEAVHRKNATAELSKALKTAFERTERKLKLFEEDIEKGGDYEKVRIAGELLAANLYALKGGEKELKVVNYFDEDLPEITLDLDPLISPSANLKNCFKTYRKKKGRFENALKGKAAAEEELEYLSTVRFSLDNCEGNASVSEIREELIAGGYLKPKKEQFKKRPSPVRKNTFLELETSDGIPVWVGKNNVQNDLITAKLASPNDIWLHVKNYPGAHVILRISLSGGAYTASQLYEAASIAASQSGFSGSTCEVDFTRVKHVRKQSGARPGMVNYTDYKTIVVKPNTKAEDFK